MSGLIAPLLCAIAGVCSLTAIQYLLLALHRWRRRAHLSFALLALSIAGFDIAALFSHSAQSVTVFVTATRWIADFGCLGALFALWFAASYSEAKTGRLLWSLTAGIGILLVVNHLLPAGLMLNPDGSITAFVLPWGETLSRMRGTFNPWAYAYYGAFAFVGFYCISAGRRMRLSGRRRRGLALSVGAAIMAAAMASDVIAQQQMWKVPHLSHYAFLPLVLIMNTALIAEVVDSSARLRRLTDASFEGIFFTQNQRIVDANEQMSHLFGFTRAQLIGRRAITLVAPEQRPAVMKWVATSLAGTFETTGRRADGSLFPIEIRSRTDMRDGSPAFLTAVRDLTEQKATLAALKASEQKYSTLFHSSPDAILVTRLDGGLILEANGGFTSVFGYTREQVLGRTTLELGLWCSSSNRTALIEQLRAQGALHDVERDFRHRDGSLRIGLMAFSQIELDGTQCIVAIIHDITDRKLAELALRTSEERFDLAVRGTNDGLWDWDIRTATIYFAPRFRELLGVSPEDFPDVIDSLSACLHPDDAERVGVAVRAHLEHRTPYDIDARLRHHDGSYRWFRTRGQAVWNELGRAVRMAGSISDIHDHRQAEEALSRSEAEFRAIFEGAAVGIKLIGPDGERIACNPAFRGFLGYTDAEFRSVTFADVSVPDDVLNDRELYRRILTGECNYHQGERRYVRKDRTILWGRRTLSPVRLPGQQPLCVVSMVEDISAWKQSEESLRLVRERETQAHADFTRRLLVAQEQERKRLATELHDSLGQHLSLIKNRATLALEQPAVPIGTARHIDSIVQVITAAISEVRNLSLQLRPLHIDKFGLTSSLESLLDQVGGSTSLQFDRRLENVDDVIQGDEAAHVYRILQEALNNLLKHAHATQVRVMLKRDLHHVRLHVEDNGCGFDPEAAEPTSRARSGLGLTSIRERVAMMRGTVSFDSAPGAGTRLRVELPIVDPAAN